jgi:hypothetical protein
MSLPPTTPDNQIKNEDDNQIKPAPSNNVTVPSPISLYVFRYANPNEDWNIQAIFPNNVKFNFTIAKVLSHQQVSSLICYIFKIQLYCSILKMNYVDELNFQWIEEKIIDI